MKNLKGNQDLDNPQTEYSGSRNTKNETLPEKDHCGELVTTGSAS